MLLWQPANVLCVVYCYLFHCLTWQINSLSLLRGTNLRLGILDPFLGHKMVPFYLYDNFANVDRF